MAKRTAASSGNLVQRQVKAHARLLVALAVGALVWLFAPAEGLTRVLLGWNATTWLFVILILKMMYGATPKDIERRAGIEEEGRGMLLALIVAACIATFIAIGSQLIEAQTATGLARALHVSLAVATIFGSWLFMNFAFAAHYAHEFHTVQKSSRSRPPLSFPGEEKPDYWDFLYFAMVIGTTFQTSDVEINSRTLRRNVLVHGVISFFYNTAVIALTVNIASQFFGAK